MNRKIREFENKLITDIGESGLPAEVVRLVLGGLLEEVTKAAEEAIKQEKEEGEEDNAEGA